MKKLLSLFFALFLAITASFSQNTPFVLTPDLEVTDSGTITREQWRDSLFRMDMSLVPTGFLLEYSLFGFESDKYDGTGNDDDTIKNDGRIFELHNILWHSKVNDSAAIGETDSLFSKAFFENRNNHTIPLTFIYQRYNRIRQTALSEGLFTIAADSVGIVDAPNRTASPYDTLEIFAFAPFKTDIRQFNAIRFTLPNDLFYMQGITGVSIDFDDGAGFRALSKGGNISIYYATEGLKYITAKITTPGGTRTAKCMIRYSRPEAYTAPDSVFNISVSPVYTNDEDYLNEGLSKANPYSPMGSPVIPCGNSFMEQLLCGVNPNANIYVENGCDNVFDKPIIVVEGFDPNGDLTIDELRTRFSQSKFISTMRGYGYDFVFVDFTLNTTYIENNAKVLEAVINWVNQHKTGNYKSTVIGFSMGGLIARWCLKDMEDRSLTHNVDNFFSYDAPQQGANIPLGMQYIFREMVRDMPYLKFNSSLLKLDDAFKSAAARQMLVTYGDYDNSAFNWFPNLNTLSPLRAAFAERLNDKGYPQQTHNYGIALGRGDNTASTKSAGNGLQFTPANPFGPHSLLFAGAIGFGLVNLEADCYAVPENNNTSTIAYYSFFGLTFRKIFGILPVATATLRVRRFDYTGQYPYDDGQGSFDRTQTEFVYNWKSGAGMHPTTEGHDGHNFVATASALDLQNQTYNSSNNWQSSNMFFNIDDQIQNKGQVNGNTLITASLSPFEAVMTSTSDCASLTGGCSAAPYSDENKNSVFPSNNNHWNNFHNTSITFQVARFIERNILMAQPVDCAGQNGLCGVTPTVSGPQVICTNGQYHLNNPPNGVIINWEIQNGKLEITGGQGTPLITVDQTGTGADIIKVTLTNACGTSISINTNVTVGIPSISSNSITAQTESNNCYYDAVVTLSAPGTTVDFSYNNVTWFAGLQYGNTFRTGDGTFLGPKYVMIYARTHNVCGTGPVVSKNLYIPKRPAGCYMLQAPVESRIAPEPPSEANITSRENISVYPNPAGSKLTVLIPSSSDNTVISIYDAGGKLIRTEQLKHTTNDLNISSYRAGLYLVRIMRDGTIIKSVKIIKQ